MHEGIPILNFLVPKAFLHDEGRLTGVAFEKVKAVYDEKGRRSLVPTGEPDVVHECDDVLVAVGQENAFPWIERDVGIEFDKSGMPVLDPADAAIEPQGRLLRRRCGARAEEHHLGRRAWPRRGHLHRSPVPRRGPRRAPAAAREPHLPEDGHPRVELRQPGRQRRALQGAAEGAHHRAEEHPRGSGARASIPSSRGRKRSAASTATCRPSSRRSCASSATPASTSAPWTASPSPPNGEEGELRARLNAPSHNLEQALYVSTAPQDRTHHGQGRGRVPALRPMRRALPDGGVGHAEIPARPRPGGPAMPPAGPPEGAGMSYRCNSGR